MSATKVSIVGLFAALLLAGAVADTATTTTKASPKAIHDLCQNTNNQQFCVDSLSKATNSDDTKTLIRVSFQLIIEELDNVIKKIDNIRKNSNDPAISDPQGSYGTCQMWLGHSIEDLQKAVDEMGSFDTAGDLTVLTLDIQTYLSSTSAYLESCVDSFEDDPEGPAKMRELIKVARELTDNGLALANEFKKILRNN